MAPSALRLVVLALSLGLHTVPGAAQSRVPVVTEHPVEGSSIRRIQAETLIHAPFSAVAARVLDYEHYPEFMLRFRTARIVRRNRGATDVYFQLELPRALGVVWFLHRMTVVSHTPNRLEVVGVAQQGNVGAVESRVLLERIPAVRETVRLTFTLYGTPVVPVLPDTVNDTLRHAVRWASILLQSDVECRASATPPPARHP